MFNQKLLKDSFLIFRALNNPLRYKMLMLIRDKAMIGVDELATKAGVTASVCSQQLRFLKDAGVLTAHRNHKRIAYGMEEQKMEKIKRSTDMFFTESQTA